MIALGVDPGLSGAIAAMCSRRGLLEVSSLPTCSNTAGETARVRRKVDARALRMILQTWSTRHRFAEDDMVAVVERMQPFKASMVTLLSMGHSAGIVEGVLAAFGPPILQPLPRQWKAHFGLAGDKKESIQEAMRRCPGVAKMSHDRAEAILLALWGLGEINGVPAVEYADDPFKVTA